MDRRRGRRGGEEARWRGDMGREREGGSGGNFIKNFQVCGN